MCLDFEGVVSHGFYENYDAAMWHWKRRMPISLEQAVTVLSRDLPFENQFDFRATTRKPSSIYMDFKAIAPDNAELVAISDTRQLNLKSGSLEPSGFQVHSQYRGQGFGRIYYRNLVEFSLLSNLKLRIFPSFIGSYAWARAKFLLDMQEESAVYNFRVRLKERFDFIRESLPQYIQKTLEKSIDLNQAESLWDVAEQTFDVSTIPGIKTRLESVKIHGRADDNRRAVEYLGKLFEHGARYDQSVKLGRFLLVAQKWPGVLDPNHEAHMDGMRTYFGGWNYIDKPLGQALIQINEEVRQRFKPNGFGEVNTSMDIA